MRCGNKLHNGIEIPQNEVVAIAPSGREYYVTGVNEAGTMIKYLDTGELKTLPKTP